MFQFATDAVVKNWWMFALCCSKFHYNRMWR